MKGTLYKTYEPNQISYDEDADKGGIEDFLYNVKYNIGDNVLLIGDIGNLGKRLRMLGVYVTILENSNYQDICYSLIHNENCNIVKGNMESLPFGDNYFDTVIILDHINYTSDCKRALSELKRVLKINGKVVLEDSNLKNIIIKLKSLKHKVCGENIRYYYPKEIIDMFSKLDFEGALKEIEDKKYIYIGEKIYG